MVGTGKPPVYDPDLCELYSRRVQVMLENGNFAGANRVIESARNDLQVAATSLISRWSIAALLESQAELIPVEARPTSTGAEVRLSNYLERSSFKVFYVWQLVKLPLADFLSIDNIGKTQVGYVSAVMKAVGLTWPAKDFGDLPCQFAVDDDRAIRLQKAGFMDIRSLYCEDLFRRLDQFDWLGSEVVRLKIDVRHAVEDAKLQAANKVQR